jgi:hypothetical protein
MKKNQLFDFMIDIVCLSDNEEQLRYLKTMTLGDFNLNVKPLTWYKYCEKRCYDNHIELFKMVHHMITYNHSFPLDLWSNFLNELSKIKNKIQN